MVRNSHGAVDSRGSLFGRGPDVTGDALNSLPHRGISRAQAWWPLPAAAALAVAAGVLAVYSAAAGFALGLIFIFIGVVRRRFEAWTALTVVLVVGMPILKVGDVVRPSVNILGYATPVQIVMIYVTVLVGILVLLGSRSRGQLDPMINGLSTAFIWWLGAILVTLVLHEGTMAAGATVLKELVYYAVPVFVVVPFCLVGLTPKRAARALLVCLLTGATLCAGVVLVTYAIPGLRWAVFGNTMYATSSRVGFGSGSIFALSLPAMVIVLGFADMRRFMRVAVSISTGAMGAAVLVSQSRTLIVAAGLNVMLALAVLGFHSSSAARRRAVVMLTSIVLASGVVFALASAVGLGQVTTLPRELGVRLSQLRDPGEVTSLQSRLHTNEQAIRQWTANPTSLVSGRGFDASIALFSAVNPVVPYRVSRIADNAWITVASKGGIILLLAFGWTLAASFCSFVRAARREDDGVVRTVWLVLALAFPMFVVESTLLTTHYPAVPAVVLALVCLTAASDLTCAAPTDEQSSVADGGHTSM